MFSQKELLTQLSDRAGSDAMLRAPVSLEEVLFDSGDFVDPGAEQTIRIYKGSKQDFQNAISFWIKTSQSMKTSAKSPLCQPISKDEFTKAVSELMLGIVGIKKSVPTFLFDLGKFRSAMKMSDDWDERSFIVETADDYIGFYWATTA